MERPVVLIKGLDKIYDMAEVLYDSKHTLRDIFEVPFKYSKKKEAFIYEDEEGKSVIVKYSDYKSLCLKYANAIKEALKDVKKGEFVGLKLSNSILWPVNFWGALIAGYKPVIINSILNKEDTERLLTEAGAKAILTENDEKYEVLSVNVKNFEVKEEIKSLDDFENEVAFCTSGTTSDSRIFVYTGENITAQVLSALDMPTESKTIMYTREGKIRLLIMIPFAHIFGFIANFLWYTFFGMCLVLPKTIAADELIRVVKKYKVSHIYSVPLFFESVTKSFKNSVQKLDPEKKELITKFMDYNNGKISKREAGKASWKITKKIIQNMVVGNSVVHCIAGGSYLEPDTLETLNGLGYPLYNGYGMTEIGVTSVELSMDPKERNKGSIGHSLNTISYRIKENHELCVKAPQIHSFCLIKGKKVPAKLDEEGYFHTGDVARLDQDAKCYIKGRLKDVIITSNGENIYPEEIEKKFASVANMNHVLLVEGKSNGKQILELIIELKEGLDNEMMKKTKDEMNKVIESLPPTFRPQRVLLSSIPFPINSSMKVKRYQVVEMLKKDSKQFSDLSGSFKLEINEEELKKLRPIIKRVIEFYREALAQDDIKIEQHDHFILDLGGDSFSYMTVVSLVEEEYNLVIPSEELGKLNTPIEFALYISKNI